MAAEPTDYPAPDLKDSSGRMRRIVIALLVAGAAGAGGYFIANALAKPDEALAAGTHSSYHVSRAYQFVGYIAGLAFIVVFLVALAVQKKLADRAYLRSLSPQARVHKS
jgi:uncharacterized membrane protein YbhN (UPF0104 family)